MTDEIIRYFDNLKVVYSLGHPVYSSPIFCTTTEWKP